MKDQWLVDYSEGELDPLMKKQMKEYLETSKEDLKELNEISGTKENLRSHGEELPDLDEAFFDRLHDKIMVAVEDKDLPKAPLIRAPRLNKHWFLASSTLGLASAMVIVALYAGIGGRSSGKIVHLAKTTGYELAEMTSYRSSNDFLVDVADQNFHDLDTKDLKALMESN